MLWIWRNVFDGGGEIVCEREAREVVGDYEGVTLLVGSA